MKYLWLLLGLLLFYPVIWLFYLAVMGLLGARAKGTLTTPARVIGYGILGLGKFLDFLGNLLATFLFFDLPREWLLSGRLSRYTKAGGWRQGVAVYLAVNFLDPYDPSGKHIK